MTSGLTVTLPSVANGFVGTEAEWLDSLGGGGGAVDSVNDQTGEVVLTATDVGAQPVDSDLSAIAALTTTAFGRALLSLADAAAAHAALALGTAALEDAGDFDAAGAAAAAQTAAQTFATNAVAAEATARAAAISTAVANLIASAPGLLDTLDELAAALGDDPNFATTIATSLAGKQPLDSDLTATGTDTARAVTPAAGAATYIPQTGTVVTPNTLDLTLRGAIKSRANDASGKVTAKVVGDTADGLFNWMHDGDAGYLFHLTGGPNFTGNAIVGIGVDYGGKGLLVNNKGTGIGINLTQFNTISSANAHGLYGVQNNTLASVVRLHQQVAGAASLLWATADATATAGQKLIRWGTGASWSTDKGYIDATSGELFADAIDATSLKVGGVAVAEYVRDTIATALAGSGLVTVRVGVPQLSVTPNDGADTITVATTATANATDTNGTTNKVYTATEKTKLAGIATGANLGLAFPYTTGNYFGAAAITVSNQAKATTRLEAIPVLVWQSTAIDRLGVSKSVAGPSGSLLRMGIYADNGTGAPGTLLLDGGNIAGDAATGVQASTVSYTLAPGLYWFACWTQFASGGITLESPTNLIAMPRLATAPGANANGYYHGGVSASSGLPTPWPGSIANMLGNPAHVMARVA